MKTAGNVFAQKIRGSTIGAWLALVLLSVETECLGGGPYFVWTDITASIVTNYSETRWNYAGWAAYDPLDEEPPQTLEYYYGTALAECEASASATPEEWEAEIPYDGPFEWNIGTRCLPTPAIPPITASDPWVAQRVDAQITFDYDMRALTSNDYLAVIAVYGISRPLGYIDLGGRLKFGELTHFDSGLIHPPWAQYGVVSTWPMGGNLYGSDMPYVIPEPVVLGEIQVEEVQCNADPDAEIGEPVNAISGAVTVNEPDLTIPCPGIPLQFSRAYNSQVGAHGVLGPNWVHNYEMSLTSSNTVFNETTNDWRIVKAENGNTYWFLHLGGNVFESPFGLNVQLSLAGGIYQVKVGGGLSYAFNTSGLLTSISDAWLNTVTLIYTNVNGTLLLSQAAHDNGQHLDFQYQDNLLTKVSSPSTNLYLDLRYGGAGELTNAVLVSSSGQYSTAYSYVTNASEHCLTQRVDAAGRTLTWGYATNETTGAIIPKGVESYASSNLAKVNFSYSSNENVTAVTYSRDGASQTYEYWYHPVMKVLEDVRGPNSIATNWINTGRGVRTAHDSFGNGTNVVVYDYGLGEWSEQSRYYDDSHRLISTAFGYMFPAANAWTFSWDTNWEAIASITDPEGNSAEWDYTHGLVSVARSYPAVGQPVETRFTYTSKGLLSSVTNANGHWMRFDYDSFDHSTQSVSQAGMTNWMTWDALGNLKQIRLPSHQSDTNDPPAMVPRVITFDPNELGWVRTITYPDTSFETFAFDGVGNVTNHVDVAGRTNRFTWLPTGKLASSSRFLTAGGSNQEAKISRDYDQQMNVLTIRDEMDRPVESYQLDLQDRPVSITNIEKQVMHLSWGLKSVLKSMTRFDGSTNTFAYDGGQNISHISYPDGTIALTYFNNNLPKTVSNTWGIISNTYDGANRLISQSQPVPNGALDYALYPAGQLSNVISVAGTNAYALDAGERLQTLIVKSPVGQDSLAYSYDNVNGMMTQTSYSNGLKCAYTFDVMDRLTGISWTDSSNRVLKSRSYTYTLAGMISNITYESDEKVAYSYDSLDRLTRERHTDYYGQVMSDERYEYDLAGNRTRKAVLDGNGDTLVTVDYSFPVTNRLGSWAVAETNLAARFSVVGSSSDPIGVGIRYGKLWVSNSPSACVIPYVDNGTNFYAFDLTCGMGTQYVHAAIRDVAGNTTYVTNRFYPTCLTNGTYQYSLAGCLTNRQYRGRDYVDNLSLEWNGQYQLTGVSTNGVLAESYGYDGLGRRIFTVEGGVTNWMVYDGIQVVAEVDDSGNLKKSYVYEGLDRAVSMTTYGAVTNTYYFIRDHLGSTLALTDAGGTLVESYRYDAWGRVLGVYNASGSQIDASAVGNRILWQGREYSWATGLYHFRARWYDPVTGRFISKDPSGIVNGLNEYVALNNNPVNFIDPTGEAAIEAYDYWSGVAVSGQDAGGAMGNLQTAGASVMMAFIDFWSTRSLENNASLSGQYSVSEGCKGNAWKHGLFAGGQIALSAASAFGGNNAVHPWVRYVGPKSLGTFDSAGRVLSGTWVTRAPAFGRNFARAADALQLPNMPNDVIRVQGAWKQFIRSEGRATGYPQFGSGGAPQWRVH